MDDYLAVSLANIRTATPKERLTTFAAEFGRVMDRFDTEAPILRDGGSLLRCLLERDDWLPDAAAKPDPSRYQQYLLYRCEDERFSVVSFVWGPGQSTPVHDHTVWGLIGVLRGAERSIRYAAQPNGLRCVATEIFTAGMVDAVSPSVGDIHSVANAHDDQVSISIHVYGADIGQISRHVYEPATGAKTRFVSGYAPWG